MYYIKRKILRFVYRLLKKTPLDMPMVEYWKTKDHITAKVTTDSSGTVIMKMKGEKETFPGFPRGHLLYGSLSKLKHEVKNQVFNESWALLESGASDEDVIGKIKKTIDDLEYLREASQFDMIPPQKMPASAREIWRAMTAIEHMSPRVEPLKRMICYVLSEDDAYRFRFQWLVGIFKPSWWMRDLEKWFEIALVEMENAEIVDDMKERIRLLRRILMLILKDPSINRIFKAFCKEIDWNKVKLTKADKYHFRGKWFKVDWDKFDY